jgi:tetratricopeptide (TPR) repeat protein
MPARKKSQREQPERETKTEQITARTESGFEHFLRAHGARVVALLCAYAALRILILAAAFPLFNNVDEQWHLISIQMYARGDWPPKDLPQTGPQSAAVIAYYQTTEYLTPSNEMDSAPSIPYYRLPRAGAYPYVVQSYQEWLRNPNPEAQSAPLYYLLGAAWYRAGEALGIRSWELPYWVRFLNAVVYGLLIWASYCLVRKVYPDRIFLWLGVPALLAVFPQDVYFGMNREVLSAPMTALALLLMVKTLDEPGRKIWLLLATSLLVGLTFLVDVSNCVLYGAFALMLWFWARQCMPKSIARTGMVMAAALPSLLPPFTWMLRNYLVMGDLTGSRAKIALLTWTMKPWKEIFHHPIFTVSGACYFLGNLVQRFWRGEYVWHAKAMSWPPADWLYLLSSLIMVTAFAAQLLRGWKKKTPVQRLTESQSLFLVLASVLFMAVISLLFDFHTCPSPSREHPFFVAGRIISGALLPFVLIYVAGMESLLRPIRNWLPAAVLSCLLVFITITEAQVRRAPFSSPYNFFALRSWQQGHEPSEAYLTAEQSPVSPEESRRRCQEAVNDFRELAKQAPHLYAPYLATALDNLASEDRRQNKLDEARANDDDSLAIRRQLVEENPSKYLPDLLRTLNDEALVAGLQTRLEDARKYFQEALKIAQQLMYQDPAKYQLSAAGTLLNLGNLDVLQNRRDEARKCYEEALNIYGQSAERIPDVTLAVTLLNNFASLDRLQNRTQDERQHFEALLKIYRQQAPQNPGQYATEIARVEVAIRELARKAPSQ